MNISSWKRNGANTILSLSGHGRTTGMNCPYTPAIRKLIYTINTVEGYHRQIRKATKNKCVCPNDNTLEKQVYLAYRNIRKKWIMPLANWASITQ